MSRRNVVLSVLGVACVAAVVGGQDAPQSPEAASATPSATSPQPSASPATEVAPSPAIAVGPTPALSPDATYVPGQRIVRLQPGTRASEVAGALGLTVDAEDPRRHTALFSGDAAELAALASHPAVRGTFDNGVMRGAGWGEWRSSGEGTGSASSSSEDGPLSDQWHLDGANVGTAPSGLAAVTVAVLDSGAAYRTWCGDAACEDGDTPTHAQAKALASISVVSPIDFVDGDALPLDEHQHGTHIATTILGNGEIQGVAPGATLMPVRVLDATNQGSEYALVQGIYHAIDNGADLINLSLAFRPGFVPSPLLLEAIAAADEAGVLIFAATGNDSLGVTAWPAVSPKVVAVAASVPEDDYDQLSNPWKYSGIAQLAPYANASSAVDIVAPGGDLTADETGDGYPDGILAETIGLGDPSTTGYWFFEGTSQAAAIATGAAARTLALGAESDEVVAALQRPARPLRWEGPLSGVGGGYLDVERTEDAVKWNASYLGLNRDVRVAVLPYLERGEDGRVRPVVRFQAEGVTNWAGESVRVLATLSDGTDAESIGCWTHWETGTCVATGDWVTPDTVSGNAWSVRVDGTQYLQDVIARPTGVLYATDALEAMLAAAEEQGQLPEDFALGIYWDEGADDELGDLAAAFTFTSGGTGLATSPFGVIATPPAVLPGLLSETGELADGTGLATSPMGIATFDLPSTLASLGTGLATSPFGITTIDLANLADVDGTGLATSPMGFTSVTFTPFDLDIDGTGLATSPFGFVPAAILEFEGIGDSQASTTVLTLDGTGLATSPMGFHGADLFSPDGGGADFAGASFEGGVAIYDADPLSDDVFDGSTVGGVLVDGGFVVDGGRDGAAVLGEQAFLGLAAGSGVNEPVYYGPVE